MTLSPSAWKKVTLPDQLPVATTCPSGWKVMQFRDLGWVYWKASWPWTVSHSWRRERGETSCTGHKWQSLSALELLRVTLSRPLPQLGFPRTSSHATVSNKIRLGSWPRATFYYLYVSSQTHGGQQAAVWAQAAASDLVLVGLGLEHPAPGRQSQGPGVI